MAYNITLPLGMADTDINVPSASADIAYDSITRVATLKNIHLHNARDAIQGITYDLKSLCLYAGIKKWAAFKPYRDLAGTQDGTPFNGLYADSMTNEIQYEKPNEVSGYVLEHFGGYNSGCPSPGIAQHGPTTIQFDTTKTEEVNCKLQLPEVDIRTLNGTPVIEKVYAKTYVGVEYDTWQRTESVTIVDSDPVTGGQENQEIYITAKIDLSGTQDIPYKIVFTVGIDIDNDCNFPSVAGGEVSIEGLGEYAAPPYATLGLGSSFDNNDALIAPYSTINTNREYDIRFGDQNGFINLDGGGEYQGPFDVIVKKGPINDPIWQDTVATQQWVQVGHIPAWFQIGQLAAQFDVQNGDNINFVIEKSI